MADEPTKTEQKENTKAPAPAKSKARYFKNTRHAGQRFMLKAHEDDPTQNQYIAFRQVKEKYQGDTRRVGYMKFEGSKELAARILSANGVEEVEQRDYENYFRPEKG